MSQTDFVKNKRYYFIILIFVALAFIVIMCGLAFYRWDNMQSEFAFDLGIYNQGIWNTMHGDFLQSSLISPGNILGQHAIIFFALFSTPFYFLFENFLGLLVFTSLCTAIGGFFLFFLSLHFTKNYRFSFFFSILFFLNPIVYSMLIMDYRPEVLALPLVIIVSFFFFKKDFPKFLVSAFLLLLVKENMSLLVASFGIYALIIRRSAKWVVLPLISGIAYFFLTVFWFIPLLSHDGYVYFLMIFKFQGFATSSLSDFLSEFFNAFSKIHKDILISISYTFANFGFLSLFSPFTYIVGFSEFVKNLIIPDVKTVFSYGNHYFSAFYSIVIVGSLLTIKNMSFKFKNSNRFYGFVVLFLIISFLVGFQFARPQLYIVHKQMNPLFIELNQLVETIPSDASVSADPMLVGKLSQRTEIHPFYWDDDESMDNNVDYILARRGGYYDSSYQISLYDSDWISAYNSHLDDLIKNHEVIANYKNWYFLKNLRHK